MINAKVSCSGKSKGYVRGRKEEKEGRGTKYEVRSTEKFKVQSLPAGRQVQSSNLNASLRTSYFVPRTSSLNLEPCALSFFMEITIIMYIL